MPENRIERSYPQSHNKNEMLQAARRARAHVEHKIQNRQPHSPRHAPSDSVPVHERLAGYKNHKKTSAAASRNFPKAGRLTKAPSPQPAGPGVRASSQPAPLKKRIPSRSDAMKRTTSQPDARRSSTASERTSSLSYKSTDPAKNSSYVGRPLTRDPKMGCANDATKKIPLQPLRERSSNADKPKLPVLRVNKKRTDGTALKSTIDMPEKQSESSSKSTRYKNKLRKGPVSSCLENRGTGKEEANAHLRFAQNSVIADKNGANTKVFKSSPRISSKAESIRPIKEYKYAPPTNDFDFCSQTPKRQADLEVRPHSFCKSDNCMICPAAVAVALTSPARHYNCQDQDGLSEIKTEKQRVKKVSDTKTCVDSRLSGDGPAESVKMLNGEDKDMDTDPTRDNNVDKENWVFCDKVHHPAAIDDKPAADSAIKEKSPVKRAQSFYKYKIPALELVDAEICSKLACPSQMYLDDRCIEQDTMKELNIHGTGSDAAESENHSFISSKNGTSMYFREAIANGALPVNSISQETTDEEQNHEKQEPQNHVQTQVPNEQEHISTAHFFSHSKKETEWAKPFGISRFTSESGKLSSKTLKLLSSHFAFSNKRKMSRKNAKGYAKVAGMSSAVDERRALQSAKNLNVANLVISFEHCPNALFEISMLSCNDACAFQGLRNLMIVATRVCEYDIFTLLRDLQSLETFDLTATLDRPIQSDFLSLGNQYACFDSDSCGGSGACTVANPSTDAKGGSYQAAVAAVSNIAATNHSRSVLFGGSFVSKSNAASAGVISSIADSSSPTTKSSSSSTFSKSAITAATIPTPISTPPTQIPRFPASTGGYIFRRLNLIHLRLKLTAVNGQSLSEQFLVRLIRACSRELKDLDLEAQCFDLPLTSKLCSAINRVRQIEKLRIAARPKSKASFKLSGHLQNCLKHLSLEHIELIIEERSPPLNLPLSIFPGLVWDPYFSGPPSRLESLQLRGGPAHNISTSGLSAIARSFPALKSLAVEYAPRISLPGLVNLIQTIQTLSRLSLYASSINNLTAHALAETRPIDELDISLTNVSDDGLLALASVGVRTLRCYGCQIQNQTLAELAERKNRGDIKIIHSV